MINIRIRLQKTVLLESTRQVETSTAKTRGEYLTMLVVANASLDSEIIQQRGENNAKD